MLGKGHGQFSKMVQYSSQQIIILYYKEKSAVLLALKLIFYATVFALPSRVLVQGFINSVYLTNIKTHVLHFLEYYVILVED